MIQDYFEIERVIEDLAKAYPAQCSTTWFKLTKNYKPSKEEYRNKVVEYMKQFEYLLATYPQSSETEKLKEIVERLLNNEIEKVLQGKNSGVERRYKHYVENSPEITENILLEDSTQSQDYSTLSREIKNKNRREYEEDLANEEQQEGIPYEKIIDDHRRQRKKKALTVIVR